MLRYRCDAPREDKMKNIVIILVSLNWFRELVAQDLSAISDQDKASLLKKYHTKQGVSAG